MCPTWTFQVFFVLCFVMLRIFGESLHVNKVESQIISSFIHSCMHIFSYHYSKKSTVFSFFFTDRDGVCSFNQWIKRIDVSEAWERKQLASFKGQLPGKKFQNVPITLILVFPEREQFWWHLPYVIWSVPGNLDRRVAPYSLPHPSSGLIWFFSLIWFVTFEYLETWNYFSASDYTITVSCFKLDSSLNCQIHFFSSLREPWHLLI